MLALIVKEFRELARDRRTLAMLVMLPIVLLVIFGYAANFSIDRVTVTIIGAEADSLAKELAEYDTATDKLDIVRIDSALTQAEAKRLLRDQKSDAVIIAVSNTNPDSALAQRMLVQLDGSRLFTAQSAQAIFAQLAVEDAQHRITELKSAGEEALSQAEQAKAQLEQFGKNLGQYYAAAEKAAATGQPLPTPPMMPESKLEINLPEITTPKLDADDLVTTLFNPDLKTSWVMIPGLIGLVLTFIGVLITSIGLVRERETGTLEQLAVMPLHPSSILLGKITPYFLLSIIDMAIVTALGVWLFGVPFVGSLWLFAIAAVVFCFVVLGIGILISAISQSTGQAIQLAIMSVVPQTLLSGLIFPLEAMPLGIRWIGYTLPLTWFLKIAQGVMLRDAGWETLSFPLTILAGMAIITFGAATLRMRFSLSHGGTR